MTQLKAFRFQIKTRPEHENGNEPFCWLLPHNNEMGWFYVQPAKLSGKQVKDLPEQFPF